MDVREGVFRIILDDNALERSGRAQLAGRTFKTYSALASTADSGAFFTPRVTGNSVLSKRKIHGQSSGEGVAATGGTMPSMPVPADKWWSIHAWGACIHVMLCNGGAERRDNVH